MTLDQLHYLRGGEALNPAPVQMVECGCCEQYHRADFYGDCRNDSQRFIECDSSLDGAPEYTDAEGEPWISIAELHRRMNPMNGLEAMDRLDYLDSCYEMGGYRIDEDEEQERQQLLAIHTEVGGRDGMEALTSAEMLEKLTQHSR